MKRDEIPILTFVPSGYNARLLIANTLAVIAQIFHVVQVDAGDDGAVGVNNVDRI